jgi:hypothetical protein
MATPPGNTPNQQNPLNYDDLKKGLKSLIETEGDYNNLLKEANKQLDSMDKHYVKIAARLDSMNKSSVNVKEVQRELTKLNEKEYIAKEKVVRLEKALSEESKDMLKEQEKLARLYSKARNDTQKQIVQKKILANESKIAANIELQSLEYAKAAVKVAGKEVEEGQETLKNEKAIQKQLGLTGTLFAAFAKKLGLGNEYYEDMVVKARKLNEENKKLSFGDKLGGLAKAAGGGVMEALTDPLTMIPLVGGAIAGVVKGVKSVFDYLIGIQDKTVKFARAMNMSTEQARQLKMQYANINVANGDLFVNTQKLIEAQTDLVGLLGITNQISTKNLATNIKLKDIAGVEADTIASITESSIINGKSNETIVKSVFAQVRGLKQATGIQFENRKILKEASSLGGVLGLQFAKYPAQLTKSLLTVKAMGLELKQLDSMADSFLDFESSISKEFEAQLLTGKDINLTKAREMFLNNDLAGAAAEINKQVGSTADFMNMNRIQQESLASAMGMSRDQMGDMLKKQEMLSKLGAKDTDNAREQLRLGLQKYKTQKELSAAIGEEAYQNLVNASTQEKIAAFIEKIKQSISDFVENTGIIGKIEKFVEKISNPETIRGIIGYIRDAISNFIAFTGELLADVARFISHLPFTDKQKWLDRGDIIQETTARVAQRIGAMGGDLSFSAAKEQAGGAGSSSGNEGGAGGKKNYSSAMGISTPNVTVKIRDRELFVVSYSGYNEGANVDQQMSTKNTVNPTQ